MLTVKIVKSAIDEENNVCEYCDYVSANVADPKRISALKLLMECVSDKLYCAS